VEHDGISSDHVEVRAEGARSFAYGPYPKAISTDPGVIDTCRSDAGALRSRWARVGANL